MRFNASNFRKALAALNSLARRSAIALGIVSESSLQYELVIAPAILVLGQQSIPVARQIMSALPDAVLYGLSDRTQSADVDVSFENFGDTLRSLFTENTPIIGVCAAGILIRTLAPLLTSKWHEPPVLAIAEDGSAVVPLLGGLHGVNDLARQIAIALNIDPAITTTGDIRFRTALLSPPAGYRLANPDDAKTFLSDLLAGATVKLEGVAPWLQDSKIPLAAEGRLTLKVTEQAIEPSSNCLIYNPATIAIGLEGTLSKEPEMAIALVRQLLSAANLSPASIAGVFASVHHAGHPGIHAIAQTFGVPARFLKTTAQSAEDIARMTVGSEGRVAAAEGSCAIAIAPLPIDANTIGQAQGQLAIVGTGPGSADWMSPEAKRTLQTATDWVGYSTYLNLVEPLRTNQQRHDSDNREELDRARLALNLATEGRSVAVVSSGDPGIFAMAAAVFEALEQDANPAWHQLDIRVAPGISALQAAAARVGAPIGHDFCVISLSDILKPWSTIERRLKAAAEADFVIALYNPVSKQRTQQLTIARDLILQTRSPETPVVLARNVGRPGESIVVRSLAQLSPDEVDMRTIVLIGSSKTRIVPYPYGNWVYTPRRYQEEK
jgi:cobalt-precorrin 5A hydrolase / precorrin-3B C17-methyltransferase